MNIVFAILAIGALIIVHEAGHYFVARWCKMRVDRFSLGFGPPIFSWRQGETDFTVGPILFGGFVQIHGMLPSDDVQANDDRAYPNRPTWQRFVTILAGPATNYLFAFVLAFVVYAVNGVPTGTRWNAVSSVDDGFDARGKLFPGDRILKVDDKVVYLDYRGVRQEPLPSLVAKSEERPMRVTVLRDGKEVTVSVTPKKLVDAKEGDAKYRLGVLLTGHEETSRDKLVISALSYPVVQTKMLVIGLYKVITGAEEGTLTGPVGITQRVKESLEIGWIHFLKFLMLLNVMLGLFNLLPLPALDGGRLAFLSYELATRRRANPKIEATVHMVGIMLLFVVLVLVTYKDIVRWWQS